MQPEGRDWTGTVLEGENEVKSSAYFVHSFSCVPADPTHVLAEVDHGGYRICAGVQTGNITAFQCHPEKSGPVGLRILKRFLDS